MLNLIGFSKNKKKKEGQINKQTIYFSFFP